MLSKKRRPLRSVFAAYFDIRKEIKIYRVFAADLVS